MHSACLICIGWLVSSANFIVRVLDIFFPRSGLPSLGSADHTFVVANGNSSAGGSNNNVRGSAEDDSLGILSPTDMRQVN